jgi:hypothetical protein
MAHVPLVVSRRAYALLTGIVVGSLALALASAGCGGGTDKPSDPSATGQVEHAYASLQRARMQGDGRRYCAGLTVAGRAQVERNSIFARGKSCAAAIAAGGRAERLANVGKKPIVIVSARVEGDRATVLVSDEGRKPAPVRFIRIGGTWKLPDPGFRPVWGTR